MTISFPQATAPQGDNWLATMDTSRVYQRQRIEALTRIAAELRAFLADAPKDDEQVKSILADCDTLDEIARGLAAPGIKLTAVSAGAADGGFPAGLSGTRTFYIGADGRSIEVPSTAHVEPRSATP